MTKPECAHSTGAAMTSRRAMRRAIASRCRRECCGRDGQSDQKKASRPSLLKAGRQAAGRMRNVDRP